MARVFHVVSFKPICCRCCTLVSVNTVSQIYVTQFYFRWKQLQSMQLPCRTNSQISQLGQSIHSMSISYSIQIHVCLCFHLQHMSVLCYILYITSLAMHVRPLTRCILSLNSRFILQLQHWHIGYPTIVFIWKFIWRRLSIILWFANSKNEAYLFVATYTPFNSNHQLMGLLRVSIDLLVITSTVQYAHHLIQLSDFNCF